jgi:outer membrane lipoprotein carrier protein
MRPALRLAHAAVGGFAALTQVGGPLPAYGQEAVAILERASERHESLNAFCANFHQVIDVTLLGETIVSRGELCQARSDRFDMRWSDPAGDRIVADGINLWVYFPSVDDGAVNRTRLAGSEGRFDLHREFLSDPGERYDATYLGAEQAGGRSTYLIALRPNKPSPYRSARVWIDTADYLIRKIEIEELESENRRIVELTNIRLDPNLAADRFQFDPPAGVQVISP